MDMDLVLIFGFILTVVAITGASINGVVQKVYDYRRDKDRLEARGATNSTSVAQLNDRTEMMEDRLRVLERLATDKGTLLADEIEALRDKRREREVQ